MFTGIIEELGQVQAWKRVREGTSLVVRGEKVREGLNIGDSIAVNGACLTVTALKGTVFEADVMPETMRLTTLSRLSPGDPVNLERAMASGGRFGGHFVSGHIDGTGTLLAKNAEANAVLISFRAPAGITRQIIKKGSVAVDGISLTVVSVAAEEFVVSLVPHTLAVTTLGRKKPGQSVNLETDMLGKYVEKYLSIHLSAHDDAGPEKNAERGDKTSSAGYGTTITARLLMEKGF